MDWVQRPQQVIANITVDGQNVSLIPVLALDTTLTQDSIDSAASTAESTSRLLTITSLAVPIALVVIGLGMITFGITRPPGSFPSNDR